MSKYAPLTEHLRKHDSDQVNLTFAEIETILGGELPSSAYDHPAWWANSRTADSHTWAHQWIAAGWLRDSLDLSAERVTFRRIEILDIESPKAREGYELDQRILASARNAALAAKRKKKDGYTCQACDFFLEIEGRHVIEVHHLDPVSVGGERETRLNDLVSLCPTCHRIAHLRSLPYSLVEIRQMRRSAPATGIGR